MSLKLLPIAATLAFCIFFPSQVFSQETKRIDSLKQELSKELPKKEALSLLANLIEQYNSISIDSSLKYGEKAIQLAHGSEGTDELSRIYVSVGGAYFRKGSPEKSKALFLKALAIRKKLNDTLGIALVKGNLMSYYGQFRKIDSAMYYGLSALKIFEKKGKLRRVAMTKSNIGALYQLKYDYDKALEYYLSALPYSKKINFHNFTASIYLNTSNLYDYKGNAAKARENNILAIEYAKKVKNYGTISKAYSNLSNLDFRENKLKNAIKNGELALEYAKKYNATKTIANAKYGLAKNYFRMKSFSKAKKYYEEVKPYYEQANDNTRVASINQHLMLISAMKKDYEEMFAFKSITDSLNDTILIETSKKNAAELETKYETEKKEKELLITKAQKTEAELKLSNQKFLSYGLLAGILIIGLIGVLIFQRNKRKHAIAIAAQREQNLQSIIFAEEKERTRIARELHDGIVQQIGATILKSRSIFDKLGISDKSASQELLNDLENSSAELRTISHQMMPRALEEAGLITALHDLFMNSLQPVNIAYNFEHKDIDDRLPKNVEITLYRITQELVNNIIKHSKASEVSVQLFKLNDTIMYMIEDNGTGFTSSKSKGIGLKNIESRIDLIKGIVNFNSESTGTLTTIKIPL